MSNKPAPSAKPAEAPVPPSPFDIAATGPLGLGPTVVGREPSEKERAAADLRRRLGPALMALISDPVAPMKSAGACLMVSHMVAELGQTKLESMTAAEVQAYGASFRARMPVAWGAAMQQNIMNFVRQLQTGGARDKAEDRIAIVKEYQTISSILAAA